MFTNNNTLEYDTTISCVDTNATSEVPDICRQYPVHLLKNISFVLYNTPRQIHDCLNTVYIFFMSFYKWYA